MSGQDKDLLKSPTLDRVLKELLGSYVPVAIKLRRGLWVKYLPAVNGYSQHELVIFRKGEFEEGGRHEVRNWPSHQEADIVLNCFFKVMKQMDRKITGNIPTPQEDSKKKNEAGEWYFAKSWVWVELRQLGLPLGGLEDGAGGNNYR